MKKTIIGYLMLTASILLIVSGIGSLAYIYLFADAPTSGILQFLAWVNSANGLLGSVNWYNYYHRKA